MSSVNEPCGSPEVSRAPEPPATRTEEDFETADPMSATWPAEYLMNVRLAGPHSDIPLFDYRLNLGEETGLWKFHRSRGNKRFDASKEDYWLFSVHMNRAEMQFLIGGEEPAYAYAVPNWNDAFTSSNSVIEEERSSYIRRAIFDLEKERLVAVLAPKATNPAITIWGQGNYAALNWVGLLVKSTSADTHEFIAVKTNKTLLPKYDDRGTVPKMLGADVTGRSITLFPKQLFGTEGKNGATYDKFVTDDPHNKLGDAHWNSIPQMVSTAIAANPDYFTDFDPPKRKGSTEYIHRIHGIQAGIPGLQVVSLPPSACSP